LRKIHNDDIRDVFSFLNIINGVIKSSFTRWTRNVASAGEMKNTHKVFDGECKEERPLGRPKCRWELNIYVNYQVLAWLNVRWIHLAHDRAMWCSVVNMTMNIRFS
jgi:hypothetical protein